MGCVTIDSLALSEVVVVLSSQKGVAITSNYAFNVAATVSILWWHQTKHNKTYPPFTLKKRPSMMAYSVSY